VVEVEALSVRVANCPTTWADGIFGFLVDAQTAPAVDLDARTRLGRGVAPPRSPGLDWPMANKVRLGHLLVRDGLITDSDLRTVLAQQKQHGGKLGEHLVRVHLCTEDEIARALARQMGVPFNDLKAAPSRLMAGVIPREVSMRLQALAVGPDPLSRTISVAASSSSPTCAAACATCA
jgi:hypothetical protein